MGKRLTTASVLENNFKIETTIEFIDTRYNLLCTRQVVQVFSRPESADEGYNEPREGPKTYLYSRTSTLLLYSFDSL